MGKKIIIVLLFLVTVGVCAPLRAENVPAIQSAEGELALDSKDENVRPTSGLPIPRFVSLAKDEAVVRTGPGLKYPIKWVYQRKNLPVEVVQEFDTWRKIKDVDGDDGWVHQALLSGTRYVIVKGEVALPVRKAAEENSSISAVFEPNVIAKVDLCEGEWCEVEQGGYQGWVQRKFLWGIYDAEDFD